MAKKKIVFISGIRLFPPIAGGHLRSTNLIESLTASYDVLVYSFTGRRKDYLVEKRSKAYQIGPGLREFVNLNILLGCLQSLTNHLKIPRIWQPLILGLLPLPKSLIKELEEAEVVILDTPYLYRLAKRIAGKTVILNSHNLEYRLCMGNVSERMLFQPLVKRIEARAAQTVDAVFCCSQEDRDFYRTKGGKDLVTLDIPNSIRVEAFLRNQDERLRIRRELRLGDAEKVILFTGSYYRPNVDALDKLQEFCSKYGQRLRDSRVTFLVVGSVSKHPINENNLVATSFVETVAPYFSAADFAFNPVETGSGTNIKMCEYIAAFLPVIATRFGTRGWRLDDGEDAILFQDDNLLQTIERRVAPMTEKEAQRLAQNAYQKNKSTVDIRHIVDTLILPYLRTCSSRGSR
jgi:glycosyltransferase involved in cell wall biosynthesis